MPPLCNGVPRGRARPGCARATSSMPRADACASGRATALRLLDVEDGSGGNLTVPPEAPAIAVVGGTGDGEEAIRPLRSGPTRRLRVPRVGRARGCWAVSRCAC